MKQMVLIVFSLFLFTDSFSQNQEKSYRKRASKVKIVLMNGDIVTGILFSFSENSLTYLPGIQRANEIDWNNRQTKEVASRDIQRISLKKQDRFLVSLAVGTTVGIAGDIVTQTPIKGENIFLDPSYRPEKNQNPLCIRYS